MFLNTLFWKTLSLCSSPKVRDQVSHPYSTTGKITVCKEVCVAKNLGVWDKFLSA
jgi:hypothetical protein